MWASGAATESKQALREIKREAEHSIMPPDLNPFAKQPSPGGQQQDSAMNTAGTAAPIHRPPSLLPAEPGAAGSVAPTNGQIPAKLPRRVDVAEDPDG